MKEICIRQAVKLAQAFEQQAKIVLASRYESGLIEVGTRQTGTLRRLSLDLTRALADMRKP